jgi:acetyl esterase
LPQSVRAHALDGDAESFLRVFNSLWRRSLASCGVSGVRRRWRLLATALGDAEPVAAIRVCVVDGPAGAIETKLIVPRNCRGLNPALLWCPGGAFLMGDAACADAMCRAIALASDCIVVVVPYRLAPEHDLYAGRNDVIAVLEWFGANGPTVGVDPALLAIGGDSAGGNIAAAVAQRSARGLGPALRLQLLCYPSTDLWNDYPSKEENGRGYLLTAESIDWIKSQIGGHADFADPWLSPALEPQLGGLPPALIVSAGFDPIRDEGLQYAALLRRAGVPVELLHYSGQFHGFLNFNAVLDAAADALQRIGRSIHRVLWTGDADDSTVEIAEALPSADDPLRGTVRDILRATSMFWTSTVGWGYAALHSASPRAADATRLIFRLSLAPMRLLRRTVSPDLHGLVERRTYGPMRP